MNSPNKSLEQTADQRVSSFLVIAISKLCSGARGRQWSLWLDRV